MTWISSLEGKMIRGITRATESQNRVMTARQRLLQGLYLQEKCPKKTQNLRLLREQATQFRVQKRERILRDRQVLKKVWVSWIRAKQTTLVLQKMGSMKEMTLQRPPTLTLKISKIRSKQKLIRAKTQSITVLLCLKILNQVFWVSLLQAKTFPNR